MSKKRSESKAHAIARVQSLFEDSLALIEQNEHLNVDGRADVPTVSFSNFLEQCEALLENSLNRTQAPVFLLYFAAGVDAGDPEWWNARFSGLAVRSVTHGETGDVGFKGWLEGQRQAGVPVVLLAPLDAGPLLNLEVQKTQVVVCHPFLSFHAQPHGHNLTLSGYCDQLIKKLDIKPGVRVLQFETLKDAARRLSNEFEFPAGVVPLVPPFEQRRWSRQIPLLFEGGAAYNSACKKFGYDAEKLPESSNLCQDKTGVGYLTHRSGTHREGRAVISGFLEQAAQIYHALEPNSGPLDASLVVSILDRCLADGEARFQDQFELVADQLSDVDRALAWLAAASHFREVGSRATGLGLAHQGMLDAPVHRPWIRVLGAATFCMLNDFTSALQTLMSDAMVAGVLSDEVAQKLDAEIASLLDTKSNEHGHLLLMDALIARPPAESDRTPVLIEVGTTREILAGQGSTRKLAELCQLLDIRFITVDMDPRNTRNAQRMFAREGVSGQAITARGEDYLARYSGEIDYVFLDAYDFDHGNHSEWRQDRYEQFLGDRIDEEKCHQMHLDCAHSLIEKMAPGGLICFDDTWTTEDGAWAAKGTTAMPFLIANGFEVLEKRNRAALLSRSQLE